MESLKEIWSRLKEQGYETDKGSVHGYLDIYATLLELYRNTAKNILEIGLFNGNSLRMWEQYFEGVNVCGIDCDEKPHGGMADLTPMIKEGCHNIHIFDACDEQEVKERFSGIKFDVVVEDAAHYTEQQLRLYNIWKNYLNEGAIYIIEDIQDLDKDRELFENIDPNKTVIILDNRQQQNRYDDVLVIIK